MLVTRTRRQPTVQLISMVDVLTFLIIFFMIYTTFRSSQAGINVNLPGANMADPQAAREIVITVDAQGRMYTAEGPRSAAMISMWVKDQLRANPQLVVTIKADRSTDYQNVVNAIDAVRAGGASRLQLAVQTTPERPL